MNIEKIEINGHYVWVDKDAEIKDDVYCLEDNNVGMCKGYTIAKCIKADNINGEHDFGNYTNGRVYLIIAASPELGLEEVPSYVEWLSQNYTEKWCGKRKVDVYIHDAFIFGYQTAEKELPTWDDVRKAIEMAREGIIVTRISEWETEKEFDYSEEEIIEQLKQDKK